jgi:hypothetical protein
VKKLLVLLVMACFVATGVGCPSTPPTTKNTSPGPKEKPPHSDHEGSGKTKGASEKTK